jgi:hypothetical protein
MVAERIMGLQPNQASPNHVLSMDDPMSSHCITRGRKLRHKPSLQLGNISQGSYA